MMKKIIVSLAICAQLVLASSTLRAAYSQRGEKVFMIAPWSSLHPNIAFPRRSRTSDHTRKAAPTVQEESQSIQEEATQIPAEHKRLIWAASLSHIDIVQELLSQGVYIDVVNENGRTALHEAAANGLHAVVRLLLAAGAHVNSIDNDGKKPLDLALDMRFVREEKIKCARLLIAYDATSNNPDYQDLINTIREEFLTKFERLRRSLSIFCRCRGADENED